MAIETFLTKLRARNEVSEDEDAALRGAVGELREYPADKTFVRAGDELNCSTLLLEGLICRYKDLRNAQRQISALHIAGDFVDLHSFSLKYLDHNLMTLTPCRVALVPHERIRAITETMPHLTRLLWFSMIWMPQSSANGSFPLAAAQPCSASRTCFASFASAAGSSGSGTCNPIRWQSPRPNWRNVSVTPVHVNRTLKELRETGLVEFRRGSVEIMDLEGLERTAQFDSGYLYLEPRAR